MNINSISANSIAASVWTVATRQLTNPSGVWSDATRQLTSIAALVTTASNLSSVSTGAILDLRPAAGKFRDINFGGGNVNTWQVGSYDGTTFTTFIGTANNANDILRGVATSANGMVLRNNAAGSVNATVQYAEWS